MRRADGEMILLWTLPFLVVLWVVAFFLFPGFLHPMSPKMSADSVGAFYRASDNLTRTRYSMILFNWVGVALIPLLMLIVTQIRRMGHRTPILSYAMMACACGGPTLFLVADTFWLLATFRPDRDPELTQMFNDLAWVTFSSGVPFLIGQSIVVALAIYLDRRPRRIFQPWVAHFNVLVAVALAPAAFTGLALAGPMAWNGMLPFWVKNIAITAWIIVMGIVVGRVVYRQRAEEGVLA